MSEGSFIGNEEFRGSQRGGGACFGATGSSEGIDETTETEIKTGKVTLTFMSDKRKKELKDKGELKKYIQQFDKHTLTEEDLK